MNLGNDLQIIFTISNKIESLWFKLKKNKNCFIVGVLYRHPNGSVPEFFVMLDKVLFKLSMGNIPCIVIGDVNINLVTTATNKVTSDYVNSLIMNNFLPTLLLPTQITKHQQLGTVKFLVETYFRCI